ncbi:MAG: AmpG family muropeptide MFS transporter [Legionella sp.]|jgi:PAT family beta-lactamase induction signal transducer AmpG|nr:AmpG family muropeptide MFS transporter [Legionella sp.]
MNKRLLVVFLLGFSSGLPLALLGGTLQAWFSSAGASVMTTGMLSLIGLPYIYRFIWSPVLDRFSLGSLGKRRSWILMTQLLLLLGFNSLAWLSPLTSPGFMAFIGVLLAFCSATQDIGIDAHRTEYLRSEEHGLGASFAVCGYQAALLLSGGLGLIMAHHLGWAVTYRIMGFLMLLGMGTILWSPEPVSGQLEQATGFWESFVAPTKALFFRPGIFPILGFILFYKLAEAFTTTNSGIVMPFLIQGLGFSLDVIGYVNKVMGMVAVISGGLVAGLLLTRYSLYKALWIFGLFQAFSHLLFVALAMTGQNIMLFSVAVVCNNLAAGMGTTSLVAFFMRWVDRRFTATQFSLLVGVASLPRILSGPIGAGLEQSLGWLGLYEATFVLTFGFIPFLIQMRRCDVFKDTPEDITENQPKSR